MDFEDIKQLINSSRERVILVENGKPTVVLMSFEDYKEKFYPIESVDLRKKEEEIAKEEETVLDPNQSATSPTEDEVDGKNDELTLDDLPF